MLIDKLSRSFRSALFFGCSVNCPICDKNFRTFLPYGLNNRENAQCVNCESLERHRLVWLYLAKETNLFNGRYKVLHVGPEKSLWDKFKDLQDIDYTAIDKFAEGYEYDKGVLNKDITNLDLPDNTYDVIIANHVLEHIIDDATAMKELYRVLKPGGWGILQVPLDEKLEETFEDFTVTNPIDREKLFGQHDHVRVYGKDYITRLEKAGFNVEVIDYISRFTLEEVSRYGLMVGEKIYLVKKD